MTAFPASAASCCRACRECCSERGLAHQRTGSRRLAVDEKARGKARYIFKFSEFCGGTRRLTPGYDDAALGIMRRVVKQARERYALRVPELLRSYARDKSLR